MFLEDELYTVASKLTRVELLSDDNTPILKVINDMLSICFKSIDSGISPDKMDATYIAQFKRVNNTWIKLHDRLEKENRNFINRDGFKNYILTLPYGSKIFKD